MFAVRVVFKPPAGFRKTGCYSGGKAYKAVIVPITIAGRAGKTKTGPAGGAAGGGASSTVRGGVSESPTSVLISI